MVEGEVQSHLGLYGASGRSVEAPLKRLIFNLDMGLDMKKGALWQRRAPLNTDTRVSASMKQSGRGSGHLDKGLDDDRVAGNGHLTN